MKIPVSAAISNDDVVAERATQSDDCVADEGLNEPSSHKYCKNKGSGSLEKPKKLEEIVRSTSHESFKSISDEEQERYKKSKFQAVTISRPKAQRTPPGSPPRTSISSDQNFTPGQFELEEEGSKKSVNNGKVGSNNSVWRVMTSGSTNSSSPVNNWDFEWQDFYYFKNMKHVPTGSTIKADAVYDNTSGNIHNPNSPPATITAGFNTADEMLVVYFHLMQYQAGDENYNMDSLMNLTFADIIENNIEPSNLLVYPNPFDKELNIHCQGLSQGDNVTAYIYDFNGKKVKELLKNRIVQNEVLQINWDAKTDKGAEVNSGLYYISFSVNGVISHQKVIKR